MNVYNIDSYWIAAETVDQAFGVFMEETNSMDNYFIDEPEEGEFTEVSITIHRLTKQQIEKRNLNCHGDIDDIDDRPCKFCDGKDDYVIVSLQDLIDNTEDRYFPCVIASEE